MSNRREFVTAATTTVGAALMAGLGTPAAQARGSAPHRVGGSPTLAAFQALEGEIMVVHRGAGRRSAMRLVKVCQPASRQAMVEQFTLVLSGRETIDGGLYRVEHPSIGRLPLRLEASGSDTRGSLMRADFSLLV